MLPATQERVRKNTCHDINQRIDDEIVESIISHEKSNREQISRRIGELEHEWDTERVLETNASILIILGTLLGFTSSKKWFFLPGVVAGFLLQHALQGWCPPLPVIRRMGVRTSSEINKEKAILQHMRGDFDAIKRD
jgi:hypothetical protein